MRLDVLQYAVPAFAKRHEPGRLVFFLMRILAIETSDQSGSVAALEEDRAVACRELDPTVRSAVSLAPAIADLLNVARWRPRDVQLVAVATGPGSFTGLRVGVTTAKMFAYAARTEVLGVNTLEAIAWQTPANVEQLWSVMEAQRDQLFAGRFARDRSGIWQWQKETSLWDNDAWLAELAAAQKPLAVSGPGLVKLTERIPPGVEIIDRALSRPKAETVGQIAWRHYQAGRREEPGTLVPHYFRPSAAEEKRMQTPLP